MTRDVIDEDGIGRMVTGWNGKVELGWEQR